MKEKEIIPQTLLWWSSWGCLLCITHRCPSCCNPKPRLICSHSLATAYWKPQALGLKENYHLSALQQRWIARGSLKKIATVPCLEHNEFIIIDMQEGSRWSYFPKVHIVQEVTGWSPSDTLVIFFLLSYTLEQHHRSKQNKKRCKLNPHGTWFNKQCMPQYCRDCNAAHCWKPCQELGCICPAVWMPPTTTHPPKRKLKSGTIPSANLILNSCFANWEKSFSSSDRMSQTKKSASHKIPNCRLCAHIETLGVQLHKKEKASSVLTHHHHWQK